MGLSKLGCASQNSSNQHKPCAMPASCSSRTLLLKPQFPHVGRTLHQDQWVRTAPCPGSQVPACPTPFLPPFGLSLVTCRLPVAPNSRASWRARRARPRLFAPEGVLPRGVSR